MPERGEITGLTDPKGARLFGTALVLAVILAAIFVLGADVRHRWQMLQRAVGDNMTWTLAQTEVEVLRLQTAAMTAAARPVDMQTGFALHQVRRRFDVLYSRAKTLRETPPLIETLKHPDVAGALAKIEAFLLQTAPVMDGTDDSLMAALPALIASLPKVQAEARVVAVLGSRNASTTTEKQREGIAQTLQLLAGATLVLVLALAALAAALWLLFRRSRQQTLENRRTAAMLETVVHSSVDGILVADAQGHVMDMNPAAESIFGLNKAALIGRNAVETLSPPDLAGAQQSKLVGLRTRQLQGTPTPARLEITARHTDGHIFPVEVSMAEALSPNPLPADQDPTIFITFLRDISERKHAEDAINSALLSAQAGEKAKADFIAVMSHEMRTPLNGMIGSVELLGTTALSADQRRLVDVLASSGDILLGHVNSILDIARSEVGQGGLQTQSVDLDQLLENCIDNQSGSAIAAGNVLTTLSSTGPLGRAIIDPVRLSQVLLNLIGNAVKFTRNGTITVQSAITPPQGDLPQFITFSVTDTGPGIAPENHTRIFDDFVSLDAGYGRTAGGTGLGLGIARRLVQAMGGTIGVDSTSGKGSTFWVRLPVETAATLQPAPLHNPPAHSDAAQAALDVLVIEDNAVNRFLLGRLLQSAGHRVSEAATGAEGVELACARQFDVVLTDISMPGMDGMQVARAIRAADSATRNARIIAVTAHALQVEQVRFLSAGIDTVLIKPISHKSLQDAMAGGQASLPGQSEPQTADPQTSPLSGVMIDPEQQCALTTQLGAAPLCQLLDRFIAEGADFVALPAETAPHDRLALCHRLAGAAGTFGAMPLRNALAQLECGLKNEAAIDDVLGKIGQIWADTAAALMLWQRSLTAAQAGPKPMQVSSH